MAFASIQQLKTALNRGARANLFEINIAFPTNLVSTTLPGGIAAADLPSDIADRTKIMCKAAAVPGFTVGTIEVPFRAGRRIKIPGDRTFADWTVTIINDENQAIRRAFNAWVNLISKGNYDSQTKSTVQDYYKDITCVHLKGDNTISRQYQLNDAFPTDVSAIDLSFDSTDTLSEFTVNFQYHYLKVGNATTKFDTLGADMALST
jgi:hypothetical protein